MLTTPRYSRVATCHQVTFLPWLGLLAKIARADVHVLLDDVQFVRREWHNRVEIKTPTARRWLTVPVASKGHYDGLIRQIRLADHASCKDLLATVRHSYSRAPYFGEIFPALEQIMCDYVVPGGSMARLNERLLRWLVNCFGISVPFFRQSELAWSGTRQDMLISCCKAVGADWYIAGKDASEHYMDRAHWQARGLDFEVSILPNCSYPQQWYSDFEYGLSAIDVLFNLGTDGAREYLHLVQSGQLV